MTATEVGSLLGMCAVIDNRTVDEMTVGAWQTLLDGFGFDECREAVLAHYRDSTEWILPAHITQLAREARRQRAELERKQAEGRMLEGELSAEEKQKIQDSIAEFQKEFNRKKGKK